MDYIREYTESTNETEADAFDFIVRHRHVVPRPLLKEMILNYRTYFRKEQKDRIVNDYKLVIINKSQSHNSDIAIGYNIVKYVGVNPVAEKDIVDYLYSRVSEHIDNKLAGVYFLRKRSVLEYIENNILIKRRA